MQILLVNMSVAGFRSLHSISARIRRHAQASSQLHMAHERSKIYRNKEMITCLRKCVSRASERAAFSADPRISAGVQVLGHALMLQVVALSTAVR